MFDPPIENTNEAIFDEILRDIEARLAVSRGRVRTVLGLARKYRDDHRFASDAWRAMYAAKHHRENAVFSRDAMRAVAAELERCPLFSAGQRYEITAAVRTLVQRVAELQLELAQRETVQEQYAAVAFNSTERAKRAEAERDALAERLAVSRGRVQTLVNAARLLRIGWNTIWDNKTRNHQQHVEEKRALKIERDALAAEVEALRAALAALVDMLETRENDPEGYHDPAIYGNAVNNALRMLGRRI